MIIQADILKWAETYQGPKFHAMLSDPPYHLTSNNISVDWSAFKVQDGDKKAPNGHGSTNGQGRGGQKGFMGRDWDGVGPDGIGIAFRSETWAAMAEHLYPGAWGMAFAGSRGWHRMACAIEDAGLIMQPTIFGWAYGCLSDDTEILTTNGWERYHKSIANSTVMCYNPDTDALEWQRVQELVAYDYDEIAYRVHSANTDQLVSRNHRCLVERSGRWVFEYAEHLGATERIPITTEAHIQAAQAVPTREAHRQGDNLPGLRYAKIQAAGLAAQGQNGVLFPIMPVETRARRAAEQVRRQRQGQKATRQGADRRGQPGMERRRNLLQETRQLYGSEVHTLPSRVHQHGPQGWICNGAPDTGRTGDRPAAAAHRGGTSYRPQPGQQSVEQLAAVCEQPRSQALRAPRIARPDLATVTPVHYRGVVWCVRVPTGAFVARRNGQIFLTGNSGFPKATRIDTQLDARAFRAWLKLHPLDDARLKALRRAEREQRKLRNRTACAELKAEIKELNIDLRIRAGLMPIVVGQKKHQPKFAAAELGYREKDNGYNSKERLTFDLTHPALEEAERWLGHRYGGQALKPAIEPIIVFQKPYEGSPLDNITTTGAGALWIDGGRIGRAADDRFEYGVDGDEQAINQIYGVFPPTAYNPHEGGRWPSNLFLSHSPACNGTCVPGCPVARLGAQSGESRSDATGAPRKAGENGWMLADGGDMPRTAFDDSGTAARFFYQADYMYERLELADAIAYVAKASRAEREAGLDPRYTAIMRLLDDSDDWDDFESTGDGIGALLDRHLGARQFDQTTVDDGRAVPIDNPFQRGETARRNVHPTIKPLSLCRYLATLLLPPPEYGPRRLLVPFAGAGSEVIGADLAGWEDVTGVELEADHVAIGNARRVYWQQRRWELGDPARKLHVKAAPKAPKGQMDMFAQGAEVFDQMEAEYLAKKGYVPLDEWLASTANYGGTAEEWKRIYGDESEAT